MADHHVVKYAAAVAYLLVQVGSPISGGAGGGGGGLVQHLPGGPRPEPLLVGRDHLRLEVGRLGPSRAWRILQRPQGRLPHGRGRSTGLPCIIHR